VVEGLYDVYRIGQPNIHAGILAIRTHGSSITVLGIGQDWTGQGQINGASGFYNWRFSNGASGRTDLTVNADGSLQGHVLGAGLNWWYVARPRDVSGIGGAPPQYHEPTTARVSPPPPSQEGLEYTRLLDHLVTQDSVSWALNQYTPGSMSDVTVQQSSDGKRKMVKGYYTYNNRKTGWVEAEFVGSHLSCLHYWNRTDCRKLGEGAGKQIEEAARRQAQEAARHPSSRQAVEESTSPGLVNGPSLCNAFVHGSVFSWRTPLNPCNE
jgi:hypothetical protein